MNLNLASARSPAERQAAARLEARQALEQVAVCCGELMVALAGEYGERGVTTRVYSLDQDLAHLATTAQLARERLRPLMIVREAA